MEVKCAGLATQPMLIGEATQRIKKMKRLVAAIASSMFMVSAGAADVYQGWAEGNSDLHPHGVQNVDDVVGIQPGVGDSLYIYGGFRDGNGDLFTGSASTGWSANKDADIYGGFGRGNPDL